MTPEGQQKLEDELEYLSTVKRREVAQQLHEATEDGEGLEENVAYEVAKNEQAFLEWRIREIEEKLAWARLVEPCETADAVRMGSTVVVQEEGSDPETFVIVSTTEARPREGFISYESPLGRVLIGRRIGESVTVQAPDGPIVFRLVTVS